MNKVKVLLAGIILTTSFFSRAISIEQFLKDHDILIETTNEFGQVVLNLNNQKLDSFIGINRIPKIKDVTVINATGNLFTAVSSADFQDLPNLEALNLDHNKITHVDFSEPLDRLQTLMLSHNRLTEIDADTFEGLKHLLIGLTLNDNDIQKIDDEAFYGFEALALLDLSNNPVREFSEELREDLHNLYMANVSNTPANQRNPLGKKAITPPSKEELEDIILEKRE